MKLWLISLTLTLLSFASVAQTFTSVQDGAWNDPNTWDVISTQGPDNANSSGIVINHIVNVPSGFSVTIDQATTSATGVLMIDATAIVTLNNGTGNDLTIVSGGTLDVSGTLINAAGSVITGSTAASTTFQAGGVYEHQNTTTQGAIPLATWDVASTLRITGYTSFATATAAGNWGQSFGNVEWNCTAQTANFNFGGLLTTVNGNLDVLATGAAPATLRFATTGAATVSIGGNFTVSGSTEIAFCTTGTATVDVAGDYTQNLSAGFVRIVEGGTTGVGTLNIGGNFDLQAGILAETVGSPGQGNINFVGTVGTVHTFTEAGTPTTTLATNLGYSVADDNELIIVGESQIAGVTPSIFTLGTNGILHVQSTDAAGAIQNSTGQNATAGNLRTATRIFNPGSQIIYDGPGAQFLGAGNPTSANVTTIINNVSGVTQVAAITLSLGGNLTLQTGDMTVSNTVLTVSGTTDLQGGNILFTTALTARTLTLNGSVILGGNIDVTSGSANATTTFGGDISGGGTVNFSGLNSNLILNGTGDVVFPLAGPPTLEAITSNRAGLVTFNETLNVNSSTSTNTMSITAGAVEITGDYNGEAITLTNGSLLTINGNTILAGASTGVLTITDGTVQTNGTLDIGNDLIITAGSLDANGTVTLTDDLTLGAGTIFYFEDQTVTLNSQLTNNGGVFSSNASSTLNILGTGILGTIAFDAGGNTLGAFTLNRSTGGTLVTLNSTLTITGTFDLLDGDFLNTSGLDFGSGAVLTRNSASSFVVGSAIPTGGPYDVFLTGSTMTTGVETQGAVQNVTSTSSATVTLGGALTASGDLLISSGTFTCNANAVSVVNLTNSGTQFNAPSTTLSVSGDLINTSAFNRNNGTVDFSGVSTISGSNNPTFQNVIISGTLASPATFNITGNFTNDGTFTQGTGTVVFTNTVNSTKAIGGTSTTTFNNLTIQNNTTTPDVTITGSVDLIGVLTLNTNAVLDADDAGAGVLTIISSGDNPTIDGSVGPLTGGTSAITGNVTVQRYMTIEGPNGGRIYRYISSPLQAATVADIQNEIPVTGAFTGTSVCTGCGVNPSMFRYNETEIGDTNGDLVNTVDDGYLAFPVANNSEVLTVGLGYTMYVRGNLLSGNALWDVRGAINQGNVSPITLPVTFTSSGTPANDGWNLVGNPYPSTIDWNAASGWTKTNVGGTTYMRDNGNGGAYATWNGVTGTNGGSQYIGMGQGFWVQTTSGGAALTANENVKSSGTSTIFFRSAPLENVLRITLVKDNLKDDAVIHFRTDASAGFDAQADAWKLPNSGSFNISSQLENGARLAINSLGNMDCSAQVQLDISNIKVGTYMLNFTEFESFPEAVKISLQDQFTGQTVDVRSGSYSFNVTSDPLSLGAQRFKLYFNTPPVPVLNLSYAENVCDQQGASIQVVDPIKNITYELKRNAELVSSITSDGGTVNFDLPASALTEGINSYTVSSKVALCSTVQEKGVTFTMNKADNITSVTDGKSCGEGTATVSVAGAAADGSYNWYESLDAVVPLEGMHNASFSTPVLQETTTYYATIINAAGCEGERVAVKAEVIYLDGATISVAEGDVLISSYAIGNQWFFNNEPIIGATNQELKAEKSGLYTVLVTVNGCETSAEYDYIVTTIETGSKNGVHVYPNPVERILHISLTENSDDVNSVKLFNTSGVEVGEVAMTSFHGGLKGALNVESLPAGLYIIRIFGSSKVTTVKVFKK